MKKFTFIYPILLAIAAIIGIQIGIHLTNSQRQKLDLINNDTMGISPNDKISTLLDLINTQYVDTVNTDSLTDSAISAMLAELDPHSVYLQASDLQMADDDLEGSFSGVGVQFNIEEDTVVISNVISGGPADKMGIRAGDRIATVDGKNFTGKIITNDYVIKKLRGKKGSKVKLGIRRNGNQNLISFTLTRNDISVSSIDASYMIASGTGYIRVNKFGENTYNEFKQCLDNLRKQGAKKYIIDLRDNGGGYLESAIKMINEFLKKGQLIVYTKGRDGRENSFADGTGSYQKEPLTILINEWSASASEIFAGAMQDNDRATIIGRRSFGKGLVQQQFNLSENSAVRLTVARYYTPSGRCIQKPYKDESKYTDEIMSRYLNGEMDDPTKYHHDKNEKTYKTIKGRTVYGGGGITPDKFIGIKLKGTNSYYQQLYDVALYDFSFFYTDHNRSVLAKIKDRKAMEDYLNSQHIEVLLAQYAQRKNKIRINPYMLAQSKDLIRNKLNACIIRNFFGDNGFFATLNEDDPTVAAAMGK